MLFIQRLDISVIFTQDRLENHVLSLQLNTIDLMANQQYYIIIDFNEVDIRIYLPEKVIFTEAARPR